MNPWDWRIAVVAMVCITIIEIWALVLGFNGVLLTAVIGVLAALGGLASPQLKFR